LQSTQIGSRYCRRVILQEIKETSLQS
jgi:hypothetical protein